MRRILAETGWAIGSMFLMVVGLLALWAVIALGNYVLTRVF